MLNSVKKTLYQNSFLWLRRNLVIIILMSLGLKGICQDKPPFLRRGSVDIAANFGEGSFAGALTWAKFGLLSKKIDKLEVGYGLRFTSFVGANKFFVTAPSKYTSPVQDLGTIFSKTIDENIDTITTATAVTNSLNFAVFIQYAIRPKLEAGFNIDLVGFSFGPSRKFNVISSVFDPNQSPVISGSPTRFNLLLTSDNDLGSLNSEFYLRYWVNSR